MYDINMDGLLEVMLRTRAEAKFARENYALLAARPHTYTLYGPEAYNVGVLIPGSLINKHARKLSPKPSRRKEHEIYQLDENLQLLRKTSMHDYDWEGCTFHCYRKGSTVYAYPFNKNGAFSMDKISFIDYDAQNRPICFGVSSAVMLFVQFYEYISEDKMIISDYRYWPSKEYAPLLHHQYAGNYEWYKVGPKMECSCMEEIPYLVDFSQWINSKQGDGSLS